MKDASQKAETLYSVADLRVGFVTDIYYRILDIPNPKQFEMINFWFPDLVITAEGSEDSGVKLAPEYNESEERIIAKKYDGKIYSGGNAGNNNRCVYIISKFVGTSNSNREKERAATVRMQKRIARQLAAEFKPIIEFSDHIEAILDELSEDDLNLLLNALLDYTYDCAVNYYETDTSKRDGVLFPFDDYVFDTIIYNAFYQLNLCNMDGLRFGLMWLLLGSLLRNETGYLIRAYDSSFTPTNRAVSETGTLLDQLNFISNPEEYESFYEGDDLDERFPGIEWYCDECEDHLNEQEGFDDHLDVWQCRKCGHLNRIEIDSIYNNEEDWKNGKKAMDPKDFIQAIKNRISDLKK